MCIYCWSIIFHGNNSSQHILYYYTNYSLDPSWEYTHSEKCQQLLIPSLKIFSMSNPMDCYYLTSIMDLGF